ncbi:MAG: Zn-dependent hydrolase [Gemmatimonadales bacterium]
MERRRFIVGAGAVLAAPLVRMAPPPNPLRVNAARLNGWLDRFDRIGRTPGGINRVGYSELDLSGREFALGLFRDAGLPPHIDPAGNISGRMNGTDPSLAPIVIGSHIDSVTDGGNFDGPVGSFAAIEVIRTLQEQGRRLRHPVEAVIWANEEGGLIGSRLAVGNTTDLDLVSRSGFTTRDGIVRIGGRPDRLEDGVRSRGSAACYIELHIEQGGRLEQERRQIGVVQGIVGLRWIDITVRGMANHAGTTPMDQRQDAMVAAARFITAVNEIVRAEPGRQVATVGRLVPVPNTRNVIPGEVNLSVDLRDISEATLDRFTARFEGVAREIGDATGTTFALRTANASAPALADGGIMSLIDASAAALGLSRQAMPSGAGHDAQQLARIAPMGMIFVPSVGGISHAPQEFTHAEDVAHGADVLLNAVLAADQ